MFGKATGAQEYYGKLIDTTVISSEELSTSSDAKTSPYTMSLSMKLPDGAPFKNGIVELDSAAFEKTDINGILKLENV